MKLHHVTTLGGKGAGPGQFSVQLDGIATDSAGRVYAVGDGEVKIFTADGALESHFELSALAWSIDVGRDSMWIGMRGKVARFDATGNVTARVEDPERLGQITALAAVGENLVLADATNKAIHLYQDGVWVREIGADVNTRGFMLPNGVLDLAWDRSSDSFVVAHSQKHRVERYNLAGELLGKFGQFGMMNPGDFGGCCNPTNIAVATDGTIAVSEKSPPRVKLYSGDGAYIAESAEGVFDENTKNIDLAFDGNSRLYASDPLRSTIEVFERVADSE